jgi:hypothetical protein
MFKDYNKMAEEYYKNKQQEWENLINIQIDKIVDKVNQELINHNVPFSIGRQELEGVIIEVISTIHHYTCKQMIDPD